MSEDEILATVSENSAGADISLIEGNKGLYDGLDLDGSNSNAALAELLQAPVVLVIDARGMTRGIAPLILGYQAFDRKINIAGVILNNLGGARHEAKLRAVIEHYTDVPVLGAVHHDKRLQITERHLGLMPSNESSQSSRHVSEIGAIVGSQVDLERIKRIACSAPPLPCSEGRESLSTDSPLETLPPLRIGIARDQAFGFYYAEDIQSLMSSGAALVNIDTLHDIKLPDQLDGLFIGGGFPELFMEQLESNQSLRENIHDAIVSGLPVYAECGGLMYLARSLSWQGKKHSMVGIIPGDVVMHGKPVGRGYVRVRSTGNGPWPEEEPGREFLAHEFHYSSLENVEPNLTYAYDVVRGHGIDGKRDGIVYKNLVACYTHFRSLSGYNWVERFVKFVREEKNRRFLEC